LGEFQKHPFRNLGGKAKARRRRVPPRRKKDNCQVHLAGQGKGHGREMEFDLSLKTQINWTRIVPQPSKRRRGPVRKSKKVCNRCAQTSQRKKVDGSQCWEMSGGGPKTGPQRRRTRHAISPNRLQGPVVTGQTAAQKRGRTVRVTPPGVTRGGVPSDEVHPPT